MEIHHLTRCIALFTTQVLCLLAFGSSARAQGADITSPFDPIVGVAATPGSSTSSLAVVGTIPNFNNYPAAESPPNAIDDVSVDKYLNFQKINAGLIVTTVTSNVVGGLRFTTGNDSPERDPLTVLLEGTDDSNATTTLNSTWTAIYSGPSGLATDPGRNQPGAIVVIPNATHYIGYRLLVLSVREAPVPANSFQFAEIELLAAAAGTAYCFGDGSGTQCPCGNDSPAGAGAGCLNSLATGGVLVASGLPSLSNDNLVLMGSDMPSSSALFFQGTTQTAGGLGAVFGDGLRCASGAVIRLAIKINAGGGSDYPVPPDPHISVKGQVTSPGTRTYQIWYRNSAPFCTAATFNLTNGWSVAWVP